MRKHKEGSGSSSTDHECVVDGVAVLLLTLCVLVPCLIVACIGHAVYKMLKPSDQGRDDAANNGKGTVLELRKSRGDNNTTTLVANPLNAQEPQRLAIGIVVNDEGKGATYEDEAEGEVGSWDTGQAGEEINDEDENTI